ncbi:MAG: PAS domain S-box protein [Asgard group archaeon]|nr:PAS domain S-box protein [Asgard group archaeon]
MSKKLNILHLEDNKIDVELVKEILILEDFDFNMFSVDNKEAFLSALKEKEIDVILADYSLPSFDGLSALKLTQDLNLNIPFILVSAVLGEELAIEALQKGAVDYVLKSRMERLVPAIKRALREVAERDQRIKLEKEVSDLDEMYHKLAERVRGFLKMDLPSGKFSLVDNFIEELSGYTTKEWYDNPNFIQKIIHPDFADYYKENFQRMQEGYVPKMLEYKIIQKEGIVRWWLQFNIGAYDFNQKLISISIVIIDNTETKESYLKYQTLFENALVGMFRSDIKTGEIFDANETMANIFDCLSIEEFKRFSAKEFYPDEKIRDDMLNKIKTNGFVKGHYMQLRTKKKRLIWVSLSAKIYREEDFIEGIMIDITKQIETQQELTKREHELEEIFEHKGTATLIIEEDMTVAKCNHQLEVLAGYTKEELEGKRKWTDFIYHEDLQRMTEYHKKRRIMEDGAPSVYECRLLNKSGAIVYAEVTVGLIPDSKRSVASLRDITEEKRAKLTLERDRIIFKLIAEAAVHSTEIRDMCQIVLKGLIEQMGFDSGSIRIYYENDRMLKSMASYGLDEGSKQMLGFISIDGKELPLTQFLGKEIFAPNVHEHEFLKKTDIYSRYKYQSFISWPIYNANKKFLGSIQIGSYEIKDIPLDDKLFFENFSSIFATAIERKMADDALRESESQYRILVESLPISLGVIIQQNNEIKYASRTIFNMFKIESIKDIIGVNPLQFFSDKNQIINQINTLYESKDKKTIFFETKLIRATKEEFPAEIFVTLTAFRGEPAIQLMIWEVTERKAIEQQRRMLVNIVDNSKEVVISATKEGKIIYANSPIEDVFGYTPNEVIGQSISVLAPPGGEQLQQNLINSIPEIGKTTFEGVRKHKNGSLIPVIVTLSAITDQESNTTMINAVIVDISNMKKLEATLKDRSYELEALNKVISAGYLARSMDELLDFTLTTVLNSLDFNGGAIYLVDDKTERAILRRSLGMSSQFISEAKTLAVTNKAFKNLFLNGKSIFVDEYQQRSEGHKNMGIHTLIGVPFFSKQKVIGGLFLSKKEKSSITKDDLNTLESIGREMGTAIAKMQAEEELIISQKHLQNIFDSLDEFLIIFDSQTGQILNVNRKAQNDLGYIQKSLLQMTIFDIINDSLEKAKKSLQNILISKEKIGKLAFKQITGKKLLVNLEFSIVKSLDREIIIARSNNS